MNRIFLFITFILLSGNLLSQDTQLEDAIKAIIKGKRATVGVAAIYDGKEALVLNDKYRFPTMSVYKFHLALAVLDHLNRNELPLNTEIFVRKSELKPNTHSPLKVDKPDGDFNISISELLKYSVSKSDNNACDILFKYVGGTSVVNKYIKSLGIEDISIAMTEEMMNKNKDDVYMNWTTPYSAVQLLEVFLENDLFSPVYKDFLIKTMIETTTGSDKIKGLLPDGTVVGHKTGSSHRNEFGIRIAENDLGFIELPNGKRCNIAIFIMNSFENDKTNNSIIARISKTIYDYYSTK